MVKNDCYKCKTEIEYDDWDFSKDIYCSNCGKQYFLECDQQEPDYEHNHYIQQCDVEDK